MVKKYWVKLLSVTSAICLLVSIFTVSPIFALAFPNGPLLVDMTSNSVTIMFYTDWPSKGFIEYGTGGSFTHIAVESDKGLVSVGYRHEVRLTGLTPGTKYNYRVKATQVTDMKAYWPTLGTTITGNTFYFTTYNPVKTNFTFYYTTDIKENMTSYNAILNEMDVNAVDFVAITGDQFNSVESESQIFSKLIAPAVNRFAKQVPLVYARGNVDMRGRFARKLKDYIPHSSGKYYYGFNQGPAAFAVLDTGEDKADSADVYSGLTASQPYRTEEYNWFANYVNTSDFANAQYKILLQHMPNFGYDNQTQWQSLANNSGVNLILAGGDLTYRYEAAGTNSHNYHLVVLGQDQLARVNVRTNGITIWIYNTSNVILHTINI